MGWESGDAPAVRSMVDAATRFGLSHEEVWDTFSECLECSDPGATVAEYVDEVAAVLARNILSKQRPSQRAQLL